MYITKQINQNECGVCVLATLVHHFYRKEVKNQLLNEANITNTGLSIFDLESLGVKYGIHFDSYQMSFDELLAMKNDGLLVIIVSKNSALHYTIIKKTKNSIEMYDSVSGKTIVKQNELKEVFQNVVLIPSKQLCKITLNNDCINIAPHFNFKYVAICIGIQLVVIVSSILGANYISEVIEKSLLIGSYKNLLILSFAFGLMFLLETLGTYVSKLFIGTHNMNISKILSSKFIDTLKYKNNDFLNKCDKNYFYLIDNAIQNIANFHSFQTIQFIASLICSVCLIIVLTAINFWYFLICAVGVILLSVCTYVHYHSSKIILRKTISNASINNGVSAECINYITQSHNIYALNKITSDLKNNYYEFSNIQKHGNFINSTLQFFIATIQKVLFIVVAGFSVYHILVNGQNLGMSKMILAITLINLFWSSCNTISTFPMNYIQYKKMLQIYHNFTVVGNKIASKTHLDKPPHKISINYENKQTINLYSGQHLNIDVENFIHTITKFSNNIKTKVLINDINVVDIDNDVINETVIVFDPYIILYNWETIINNLQEHPEIIEFIKKFNFKIRPDSHHIDISHAQTINLLFCCTLRHKVLIFNNSCKYIKKEYQTYFEKNIIPVIKKNNFLIFCD